MAGRLAAGEPALTACKKGPSQRYLLVAGLDRVRNRPPQGINSMEAFRR
jgi:hypothetical protein